ncbi:MAG: 4-hydroxy-3-methylbut-2-enyl diphosphate reductase [Gammaproteobacteria bacterium]|nr:MAG: 4-hydroxy-3-methylbut-2-enyl diphosphate reductase [Gammaproteobacteria bacterium]
MKTNKFYIVASPRGFCAGVKRAILIVEQALKIFNSPVYVRHEVVHNKYVVDNLKKKGVIFVESIDEIPDKNIVILSAHGVAKKVLDKANNRDLKVFDATCPLVTKVHMEVLKYSKQNMDVILIGHKGHPEVIGTMGRFRDKFGGNIYLVQNIKEAEEIKIRQPNNLALVKQTTLSVDDTKKIVLQLQKLFPNVVLPTKDDICYATQNRQDAIGELAKISDTMFIVGSSNSSNSNRLKELAITKGVTAYLVDDASYIKNEMIKNSKIIGISAGASAPEELVLNVIDYIKNQGFTHKRIKTIKEEKVSFSIIKELR